MAGNPSFETEVSRPNGADRSPARQTDDILMAEVVAARSDNRSAQHTSGPARACEIAMQQYLDTSPDIFKVRSGPYRGMNVPESLRCAIFQSNVARDAGLISPRDVTVRALEFGALMDRKGYRSETFNPDKSYPDGTYIVGNGARDGTNSRHVGIVCNGRLLHTKEGRVLNEPISNKFFRGAYDRIKVYIPPRSMQRADIEQQLRSI